MRISVRALCRPALLLGCLLSAAPLAAQTEPAIAGFEGVPWGARRDAVVAALGRPVVEGEEQGAMLLAWEARETFWGKANVWAFVDPAKGLVAGIVSLDMPPGGGDGCRALWDRVVAEVTRRHPRATYEFVADPPNEGRLCDAVRAREAYQRARWTDPVTGAQVVAMFDDEGLAVQYQTAEEGGGR